MAEKDPPTNPHTQREKDSSEDDVKDTSEDAPRNMSFSSQKE